MRRPSPPLAIGPVNLRLRTPYAPEARLTGAARFAWEDDGVATEAQRLIRPARPTDAEAIVGLLAELGYPDHVPNVRARLKRLHGRDDAGVFVAEIGGQVAALAAYQLMDLLERAQPQCRITTLVVHPDERRRGLASALLGRIESIANESRCFRLEVTTQAHRRDALDLYLALGFHERPRRLVKPLASS
jgi:ribosomal protein S18 acetylase RimI-like enzyme